MRATIPSFRLLLLTAILPGFLIPGASCAQVSTEPEDTLTLAETTEHIRFIASDELKGRRPGTPGGLAAARYIAERFQEAGLQTLPGAEEYFQDVALATIIPATAGSMDLLGKTFTVGEGMIVAASEAYDVEASYVFASYGTEDDYEGLDTRGKIVVVRSGLPPGSEARPDKPAIASDQGAQALIFLYEESYWPALVRQRSHTRVGLFDPSLPVFFIDGTDSSLVPTLERQPEGRVHIQTSGQQVDYLDTPNVVGLITGSDPDRRDEYVILTAHYDHIGVRPPVSGAADADSIYNGARDNGMGIVALINAAKALSARPPARSILFLAVTAEEMGLLGSRYYVDHPLVPLDQTVFVLNVDTGGYSDTSLVTVFGLERTSAEEVIREAAADYDLTAIADPSPEEHLFDRSDNVSFARKGIPAPTFSPGFRSFSDAEIQKYYHKPADEADENFDFAYLLRFTKAFTRAARRIADLPEPPRWTPGDPYESAALDLYGTY